MMKDKFTVAMSVYKNDKPEFLDRALESITEKQSILPDEIVLVVDGPIPEELNQIIFKYEKRYSIFNTIRLPKNLGLGNALRLAVKNSRNELIARMDSDDVSTEDRFEKQLECFRNDEQLDIVGGNISEFVVSEENIVGYRNVPQTDAEIKTYLKTRCPLNHVTVMFKKSAVLDAGGYLDLFWNEDYYLWIRMAENKSIMNNIQEVLVNVRTGADMYQRRGGKKYFKSEKFLQQYMLKKKIINRKTYYMNITKRFIVQILLPNRIRGIIFRTLAREK